VRAKKFIYLGWDPKRSFTLFPVTAPYLGIVMWITKLFISPFYRRNSSFCFIFSIFYHLHAISLFLSIDYSNLQKNEMCPTFCSIITGQCIGIVPMQIKTISKHHHLLLKIIFSDFIIYSYMLINT